MSRAMLAATWKRADECQATSSSSASATSSRRCWAADSSAPSGVAVAPGLRSRLFRGVLDGVLRGGTGRGHRQLPQPDRRAMPKQGEQARQELIGERFLHRDRGHYRVGQQPGSGNRDAPAVTALATAATPHAPAGSSREPAATATAGPPSGPPATAAAADNAAPWRHGSADPPAPGPPAARHAHPAPDGQLRPARSPAWPRLPPRRRKHTAEAGHWSPHDPARNKYQRCGGHGYHGRGEQASPAARAVGVGAGKQPVQVAALGQQVGQPAGGSPVGRRPAVAVLLSAVQIAVLLQELG